MQNNGTNSKNCLKWIQSC